MIVDGVLKVSRTRGHQVQGRQVHRWHEQEPPRLESAGRREGEGECEQRAEGDLGGAQAASGGDKGTPAADKGLQGAQDHQKKIDKRDAEVAEEGEGAERGQVRQVLGHQEHQEHEEVEQEDQESAGEAAGRDVREPAQEGMIMFAYACLCLPMLAYVAYG